MQSDSNLRETLRSIDHKSYPAYKSLRGSYRFADYVLSIDHVQGDPFAAPSHVRVTVDAKAAAFPEYAMKNTRTRTALADELLRTFAAQINHFTFKAKGSGKSGLISVTHCGQEILTRTACEVNEKEITARFAVGFPANGRTINARELEKILFTYLPECVKHSFYYKNLDARRIRDAVELAEDQQAVRDQLKEQGLVAFVADDAVLPRESGISSRPMKQSVAFTSPESLRVTMQLPHRGAVTGMGIPKGITLIVGGGYHGKSTLLTALEQARGRIGSYCKACWECNGRACKNQMPGPGAKGIGDTAIRNYDKWKEIRVQMDTLVENRPCDTTLELFGRTFQYPFFAGPVGAVQLHYGDCLNDISYNDILVSACAASGIAAFTGDVGRSDKF